MGEHVMNWDHIQVDKERVIALTGINPLRVRNIYVYGSQVYGTYTPDSDIDILVTACSMDTHKEYHDGTYNVHVVTPDIFEDRLRQHDMQALECILAPPAARIQTKTNYYRNGEDGTASFKINRVQLQKKALSQSTHAWYQAKFRINDGDLERGEKSMWHGLRILAFAIQILDEGCIYDFGEANNWFEEIKACEHLSWGPHSKEWLPLKIDLEKMVKGRSQS
jgi:predicted nucleotidyltransferase